MYFVIFFFLNGYSVGKFGFFRIFVKGFVFACGVLVYVFLFLNIVLFVLIVCKIVDVLGVMNVFCLDVFYFLIDVLLVFMLVDL